MRIAVTRWGDKISPVFDEAKYMMIVDVNDDCINAKITINIGDLSQSDKVKVLTDLNVERVFCGAISNMYSSLIEASGIELNSWLTGDIEEILQTVKFNDLPV
ncbi:MAG: NifB/NifX family molybdenum-iron cluster-binding protein [Candidatus Electryonea clarkiae]|nr:NifB/NifX family molybdenum-iron cluster-binding protein [Candidatus Electryonea clarkiae]